MQGKFNELAKYQIETCLQPHKYIYIYITIYIHTYIYIPRETVSAVADPNMRNSNILWKVLLEMLLSTDPSLGA